MERERTLALLSDTHTFPGPYTLRVIVRPGGQDAVLAVVLALCGDDGAVEHVEQQPSAAGNWISVRVRVFLPGPEPILAMYDAISKIEAVVMTL